MENREKIQINLENLLNDNQFEHFLDSREPEIIDNKSTRIELRWLEIENLRSQYYWYPFYPRSYIGETQDDCIDTDRLISFDEDISDFLFDLNNNEFLKFKLLLKFLSILNIVDLIDEESNLNELKFSSKNFLNFLPFPESPQEKNLVENFINFIRRILDQSINKFTIGKYKTQLTILKWKFEHFISNQIKYLNTKESLNEAIKNDLSMEANRSDFVLWKNYAILKYNLNSNLKETRKVFNTLLNSSESANSQSLDAFIEIYQLCVDFVELELGIYCQDFDVTNSTVNIKLSQNQKIKLSQTGKENLIEILVNNCLYKSQVNQRSKSTFKIGISGGTKQLLVKRDFQVEYEKIKSEGGTKFFLFHKIYSFYLLLSNDVDLAIDLNESNLSEAKNFKNQFGEFYLKILDYIYHCLKRITKFKFKIKLYSIIKQFILFSSKLDVVSGIFLNQLKKTLIQFRYDNQSNIFVNQLIETNDVDELFEQISLRIKSGSFLSALIDDQFERFKKMMVQEDNMILYSGIHNKIRRLFEKAILLSPKNIILWEKYFDFEIFVKNLKQNVPDKINFVYYRSIQNLPFIKKFYLYSIEFLPEKYNEIIKLMEKKELRFLFPVQELNILLEPIDKMSEIVEENELSEQSQESESESEFYESSDDEINQINLPLTDSDISSSSIENVYQE